MINRAILVTGGTGFIGRHLVHELARENPHSTIRVLSRRVDAVALFEQVPNVVCVRGDLTDPIQG